MSGGCSVWQMRILEDIIMFSSFRKIFQRESTKHNFVDHFLYYEQRTRIFQGILMSGKVDHSFCQSLERSWVPRCDLDWETRRKSLKERIHGAPTDLLTLPLRASKDSSFPYSFFLISYGSVCAGWEFWLFNVL